MASLQITDSDAGKFVKHSIGIRVAVPDQPTADHRPRPAGSTPAVHIRVPAVLEAVVDEVEDLDHQVDTWDRNVRDRKALHDRRTDDIVVIVVEVLVGSPPDSPG